MSRFILVRVKHAGTPWSGYFASAAYAGCVAVGEYAFKSAPVDGRLEIAHLILGI